MSLLNGLKESLKNQIADNDSEMDFVFESDFEFALEKATDVRLSPDDIAAILNGDDDIDDDYDDDEEDDVDLNDLEECTKATEATLSELENAANELDADDDVDDIDFELDPEEDEIITDESLMALFESLDGDCLENIDEDKFTEDDYAAEDEDEEITDESLIAMLEADCECEDYDEFADTGDASIPKNSGDCPDDVDELDHDTGEASIPENLEDPTPHGIEDIEAECEALLASLDCDLDTETGAASEIENVDDPTPEGDEEDPGDMTDSDGDETVEEAKTPIPDDDENVKVEDIEEEGSFEAILGALLENPM